MIGIPELFIVASIPLVAIAIIVSSVYRSRKAPATNMKSPASAPVNERTAYADEATNNSNSNSGHRNMDKPSIVPVLIGVGTILTGCLNTLMLGSLAFVLALALWELPADVNRIIWGCFALIPVLSFLLIPAGIGILLHYEWGLKIASAATFGIVMVAALGTGLGVLLDDRLGTLPFSGCELVMSVIGAVILKVGALSPSMKSAVVSREI